MRIHHLFENSRLIVTPAFQRWFSGSKVVDSAGKPQIVYHGTNQPVDRFKASRRGLSTRHPTAREAFWFTDSTEVAADYAQGAGERVRAGIDTFEKRQAELRQKAEALERLAQRTGRSEDWDKAAAAEQEWENLEIDSMRDDPMIGQNIVTAYLRIVNPLVLDAKGAAFINVGGYHVMNDAIDDAKRQKHDGLIIHHLVDAGTSLVPATHYAVFNARQIKSAISG